MRKICHAAHEQLAKDTLSPSPILGASIAKIRLHRSRGQQQLHPRQTTKPFSHNPEMQKRTQQGSCTHHFQTHTYTHTVSPPSSLKCYGSPIGSEIRTSAFSGRSTSSTFPCITCNQNHNSQPYMATHIREMKVLQHHPT